MNLDLAAIFAGLAGLLAGIFAWTKWNSEALQKANEDRIGDLKKLVEEMRKALAEAREDFESIQTEQEKQIVTLQKTVAVQEATIRRSESMIGDYMRHQQKLERIMYKAGLEIPEFETTEIRAGEV